MKESQINPLLCVFLIDEKPNLHHNYNKNKLLRTKKLEKLQRKLKYY